MRVIFKIDLMNEVSIQTIMFLHSVHGFVFLKLNDENKIFCISQRKVRRTSRKHANVMNNPLITLRANDTHSGNSVKTFRIPIEKGSTL